MKIAITVIDAHCGAGKTSWAIQEMQKNTDAQYIFVTPFLDEIKRIQTETRSKRHFKAPCFRNGGRKLDDFNTLLANGDDIATTHSTFANSNEETLQLLQDCFKTENIFLFLTKY